MEWFVAEVCRETYHIVLVYINMIFVYETFETSKFLELDIMSAEHNLEFISLI